MGVTWRRQWLVFGLGVLPALACSRRSLWFGQIGDEPGTVSTDPSLAETDDIAPTDDLAPTDAPEADADLPASAEAPSSPVTGTNAPVPDAGPAAPVPEPESCEAIPSTPQQRFLTNRQYDRTIGDLLGVWTLADGNPPSSLLGPDHPGEIDAITWAAYQRAADQIAQQVVNTPELLSGYVTCNIDSTACLQQTVIEFGRRAFRRPLTNDEVHDLSVVIERGVEITENGTPTEIAEVLLYTFLVSPSFLLRSEMGDETDERGHYLLSDHEVAQRLSYALWGTMPDAELFATADRARLHTEDDIRAQALRMLQDDKARPQAKLFHAVYVGAEGSPFWSDLIKDAELFPDFPTSTSVFRDETELFFEHVMFEQDGEFEDLFTSSVAFVNEHTAPLYGFSQQDFGADFELVDLDAEARPGFLTRVGFLAANAFPSRTWPSRRGAEILRHVIGMNVGQDSVVETSWIDDPELDTVRKQVDAITNTSSCESCHAIVNPLGFVLEAFDAVGRAQTHEARTGAPIDTRAEVTFGGPDVEAIWVENPYQLMVALAQSPTVSRTYARSWSNFVHERQPGEPDYCVANELGVKLTAGGYTIREMLTDIVASESFYKRVPRE